MPSFDFNSISSRVKTYLKSPEGKRKLGVAVTSSSLPEDAADKFIEVLRREISSNPQLSKNAIEALSNIKRGPVKLNPDSTLSITIYFDDVWRPSLTPQLYPRGADDISVLLNSGYAVQNGNSVYGVWQGHTDRVISSLPQRSGAHFVEQAIRVFMSDYADKYGVVAIKPDPIYGIR